MSLKNRDEHNRWRSKTVAFRVSPEEDAQIERYVQLAEVLLELQRIETGGAVNDELLDLIEMIADILGGMKEESE